MKIQNLQKWFFVAHIHILNYILQLSWTIIFQCNTKIFYTICRKQYSCLVLFKSMETSSQTRLKPHGTCLLTILRHTFWNNKNYGNILIQFTWNHEANKLGFQQSKKDHVRVHISWDSIKHLIYTYCQYVQIIIIWQNIV